MIVFRCFAWNRRSAADEADGPLWFPRVFQGDGRHDNPDVYGCLYVSEAETSAVVEQLARFRGQRLTDEMLVRRRLPLAVASIEVPDDAPIVDLDEPRTLVDEALRPSLVATRSREVTQPQALALYLAHPTALALRWWSSFEALWGNVTLFDRAAPRLGLLDVRRLARGDASLSEAADLLGVA